MSRTHSHELFYRSHNGDGTCSLTRFAAHTYSESEAREDLIRLVEGVAKDGKTLNAQRDGIIYKVDGKCEFFVSRYFYLWPNYTDREDRHGKGSGKGQQRRDQHPRGRSRGASGPVSRAA